MGFSEILVNYSQTWPRILLTHATNTESSPPSQRRLVISASEIRAASADKLRGMRRRNFFSPQELRNLRQRKCEYRANGSCKAGESSDAYASSRSTSG